MGYPMPNITICEGTGTLGINEYPIMNEKGELVRWIDSIIPNCNYTLDENIPV